MHTNPYDTESLQFEQKNLTDEVSVTVARKLPLRLIDSL